MVDTISTKNNGSKAADTKGVSTSSRDTTASKAPAREDVGTQGGEDVSEEEKAEREENEARSNGFKYASSLDETEPKGLESEADQSSASWLVANGYAEMHSIQEGFDTINYVLLTEDGKRALSTYNEEAE